ncbi:MAG TPA: hypothetical protein VN646_02640 [Candidatus Acidoferrum sp.]|jgi:hypothetical protein|nr:hypothetical protein [Candidatus Acidoferrum sp.]
MMTKGGITAALLGSALLVTATAGEVRAQVIVDEPGMRACRELKDAFEAFVVSRDGPAPAGPAVQGA